MKYYLHSLQATWLAGHLWCDYVAPYLKVSRCLFKYQMLLKCSSSSRRPHYHHHISAAIELLTFGMFHPSDFYFFGGLRAVRPSVSPGDCLKFSRLLCPNATARAEPCSPVSHPASHWVTASGGVRGGYGGPVTSVVLQAACVQPQGSHYNPACREDRSWSTQPHNDPDSPDKTNTQAYVDHVHSTLTCMFNQPA